MIQSREEKRPESPARPVNTIEGMMFEQRRKEPLRQILGIIGAVTTPSRYAYSGYQYMSHSVSSACRLRGVAAA